MVFSPGTGPESVQVGYVFDAPPVLRLHWAYTRPFHYDKFIVRVLKNSILLWQSDVYGMQDSGFWQSPVHVDAGLYNVIVEGCDDHGICGSTCRQGWSLPVSVPVN